MKIKIYQKPQAYPIACSLQGILMGSFQSTDLGEDNTDIENSWEQI